MSKKPKKHIRKEGARFHVLSWGFRNGEATSICSEPHCEINYRNGGPETKFQWKEKGGES